MPFFVIEEFDSRVLNVEGDLSEVDLDEEENVEIKPGLRGKEQDKRVNGLKREEYGVFVFYQNDLDGICSMFILEHHKRFRKELKLTSYPVTTEADIYTYIKKSLSIRTVYPSLSVDKYLRVVLLGMNGWNEQVLYSIKLYFEQLLPKNYKKLFKIAIVTTVRPLSFFNSAENDEWYFFFQDENDLTREQHEQEEAAQNADKQSLLVNGVYKINAVSAMVESMVDFVNECDKAIILFANCVGILSNYEFNDNYSVEINKQIVSNYNKILLLQGGPYTLYDTYKLLTPLITLSTFEESLKISPYVLIHDPNIRNETLSDVRIYCNLKLDEYTSHFSNLHPMKQIEVLKLLKNKLGVTKNFNQLCWIRRTLTISSLDILYIVMAVLSSYPSGGSEGKNNPNNMIMIMDFLYNILIERINENGFYDKNVLTKLKTYTTRFIEYIFKIIITSKIKVVNTGYDSILTTIIHPTYPITQTCHLNFISYLIISIYIKNNPNISNIRNLMLFVSNPLSEEEKKMVNPKTKGKDKDRGWYLIFGYNCRVGEKNRDLWPLIFKSVAHENSNFVLDCLNPNILHTKVKDTSFIRNNIVNTYKIISQIKQQGEEMDLEEDELEVDEEVDELE